MFVASRLDRADLAAHFPASSPARSQNYFHHVFFRRLLMCSRRYSFCICLLMLAALTHSTEALPKTSKKEKNSKPSITNSIGMKLVLIHHGEFEMGSHLLMMPSEQPWHKVTLTKDYSLA